MYRAWTTFLAWFFKKVQGINKRHHFYMTGVAMRDLCGTQLTFQDLLEGDASELCLVTMPLKIGPKGHDMGEHPDKEAGLSASAS